MPTTIGRSISTTRPARVSRGPSRCPSWQVNPSVGGEQLVSARLRLAAGSVVGHETRKAGELDYGEQPAAADRGDQVAQRVIGAGEVVQRSRRTGQVDRDMVIRPHQDEARGMTTWLLSRGQGPHGLKVAKIRLTQPPPRFGDGKLPVHPGPGLVHRPVRDGSSPARRAYQHRGGRSGRGVLHRAAARLRRRRRTRRDHRILDPDGGPAEIIASLTPTGDGATFAAEAWPQRAGAGRK